MRVAPLLCLFCAIAVAPALGQVDSPELQKLDVRVEAKAGLEIKHGRDVVPGKQSGERIVYNWNPPNRVTVAIETSKDGVHWDAVNQGEGVRQQ